MTEGMLARLLEATRLTRTGRLDQATDAIQRALGGAGAPAAKPDPRKRPVDAPIEGSFRVIDPAPRPAGNRAEPAAQAGSPTGFNLPDFGLPWQGFDWQALKPQPLSPRAPEALPEGAKFVTGAYTNAAGTRAYKLYIPSGYRGRAMPLVVMLHGCTQDPDDFAAGTRMNRLAEEQNFLVLYPAQGTDASFQRCWNWFKAGDQQRDQGEPSIIADMTREIAASHAVDRRRIFVAGLSAGGAMAAIMGSTYPDLYAAVGVHSGLAQGAARDLPSAFAAMYGAARARAGDGHKGVMPTIIFHGDRDNVVHPRNGDHVAAHCTGAGPSAESEAKPRARTRRGRVPDGHEYTQTVFLDERGQSASEQWVVHGAGHAWAGGSAEGSYTDARGPDASREMLRFFYEHPRKFWS